MEKIVKGQIVAEVAERTGMMKKDVFRVVNEFLTVTGEILKDGCSVGLQGFGTFTAYERAGREVCTPAGGRVIIPPRTAIRFKPSKNMVKEMNESEAER